MEKFQSFWYGETLPEHVVTCMKSFLYYGHEFELYSFGKPPAPDGVVLRDANEILNEDELFFYVNEDGSRGSVSAFSNLFRYELLNKKGGWWVDTDVLCLSSSVPQHSHFWGWEDDRHINGAILKIPKNDGFLNLLLENSKAAGKELYWGQIGPRLITKLVRELNLENMTYPSQFAYPLHWDEYRDLVSPSKKEEVDAKVNGVPFLHLWNEKFRLDKEISLDGAGEGSYWYDTTEFYRNFNHSMVGGAGHFEARAKSAEMFASKLLEAQKTRLEPLISDLRKALSSTHKRIDSLECELCEKQTANSVFQNEILTVRQALEVSEHKNLLAQTLIESLSKRVKLLEERKYIFRRPC